MKILEYIIYGILAIVGLFGLSFVCVLLEDLLFGEARRKKGQERIAQHTLTRKFQLSSKGAGHRRLGNLKIGLLVVSCGLILGVTGRPAQAGYRASLAIMCGVSSQVERGRQELEVAKTIAAEAAGEGYQGMYAIACTIANRARMRGLTPFQVVSQKNQYYGFTAKNRTLLYLRVKKQADFLAQNLMLLKDITGGAIYFRRPNEKMFSWCKVETYRYHNHIFYR